MSEEDVVSKLSDQVDDLTKAVFVGNGHPSLREEMATNRSQIKSIDERLKKIESSLVWITRLVIGSVIGQLLLLVYKLKS